MMAKSTNRAIDESVTMAADRPSKSPRKEPPQRTDGDIARRAYDLYLARGREHGHDVDDWLTAERELRVVRVSNTA